MSDYNNGTLPDPCLRLDYGFGEEWATVELGDGTGYVRLTDYERLRAENEKLRSLVRKWYPHMLKRVGRDALEQWGQMDVIKELGIEVYA